jgi:hypothetical protein
MIDYEKITAQAAELARQFLVEIEAELARQNRAGGVDRVIGRAMAGQPHLRDDEVGLSPLDSLRRTNATRSI